MNPFQWIALVIVFLLILLTLMATVRGWISKRETVVWVMVWLAAGITLVWPKLTSIIAKTMGIGRGADLLLYSAVVVMMVGFLMVYVRLRNLRREMTLLVRQLALRDAITNASPSKTTHTSSAESEDSPT